ncbi:YbjQ family protein [Aliikangiella coralliicola]|uniref:YbjQ family protein n=1 Tax=Aliikangiella coralliicola TaxID=2592383 RepID=A0A545UK83_9GAMM|nr:YbjQ family protein [Aliikangiella coralliicola]
MQLLIPLALVLLGLLVGSYLERRHYVSIREREEATRHTPVVNLRKIQHEQPIHKSYLVTGSAVISVDYFKRLLAALRNIFGGRVVAYESLVDRARREAILRMKAKCPAANIIINLKIETSTISKQGRSGERSVGCVEAIAYGTAIHYQPWEQAG